MLAEKIRLPIQFVIVFLSLAVLPALYFIDQYQSLEKQAREYAVQNHDANLEFSLRELHSFAGRMTRSVRDLSNNSALHNAIESPTLANLTTLSDFWTLVARSQGYFSQLRLLDVTGMEIVRIQSDITGTSQTPKRELESFAEHEFFQFATSLTSPSLASYGIDLEMDNGVLVRPLKPTIRMIKPIYNRGTRVAYFVANINLFNVYPQLAYNHQWELLPEVVNESGYFVLSKVSDRVLGNIAQENEQETLANQSPELWQHIQNNTVGVFNHDGDWTVFKQLVLDNLPQPITLHLMLKVPREEISHALEAERQMVLTQGTTILVFLLFLAYGFVMWNHRHEKNSIESEIARAAIDGISAVIITDKNNRIVQVNNEFTRLSGYSADEVIGRRPSFYDAKSHPQSFYLSIWRTLHREGLWQGEVVNHRKDGVRLTQILRIQSIKDRNGIAQYYVASFVDITERKELENRLRDLSEKDALSNTWNRRKFDGELKALCGRIKRYGNFENACLAILDIDHFKRINDNHGHDVGDTVIRAVADTLSEFVRETDFVSRIGGEEFAILMPHTEVNQAHVMLERLRESVQNNSPYQVTISTGLTDVCGNSVETYKRADVALYESKSTGRNKTSVNTSQVAQRLA